VSAFNKTNRLVPALIHAAGSHPLAARVLQFLASIAVIRQNRNRRAAPSSLWSQRREEETPERLVCASSSRHRRDEKTVRGAATKALST
jgi:hypothetical protein